MPIADFEIVLPYEALWDADWGESIRAADEPAKRMLHWQRTALESLRGLRSGPATPERLAWLALWTRGFMLLRAAFDLRGTLSEGVARGLCRNATELLVHVEIIREPWESINEQRVSSGDEKRHDPFEDAAAWRQVQDRLRAFCAWALTHDLRLSRRLQSDSYLDDVFVATAPDSIWREGWESKTLTHYFGEQEIVSRAETEYDKSVARNTHDRAVARLLDWLADPALGAWREQFEDWIIGPSKRSLPSFSSLFSAQERTFLDRLRNTGAAFAYLAYQQGSMLTHGSTIDEFIYSDSESERLRPRFLMPAGYTDSPCRDLSEVANRALLGLWGLRDRCIPRTGDA